MVDETFSEQHRIIIMDKESKKQKPHQIKTLGLGGRLMEKMIQLEHVRKVYRLGDEKVVAVDDISLDITAGEVCCLLGTSGFG